MARAAAAAAAKQCTLVGARRTVKSAAPELCELTDWLPIDGLKEADYQLNCR